MIEETDDERNATESAIAEFLSAMSSAEQSPIGFDVDPIAYSVDEILDNEGTWIEALSTLQGWLKLDATLEASTPSSFYKSIAAALEYEDPDDALQASDSSSQLTQEALERLRNRAELASRNQEIFLDELQEEGGSRQTATRKWEEAWSQDDESSQIAEPVSATANTWPIREFMDRAKDDELDLSPSYQRGDVWPTSDSQLLIASILRGIPLPSVIILRPRDADAKYEVVDGKQRLTAILRFIGKHPTALNLVETKSKELNDPELARLFEIDYVAFRTRWRNKVHETLTATLEQKYYFPFRTSKDFAPDGHELEKLEGKYYTQIKEESVNVAGGNLKLRTLFESSGGDYKLPVIIYNRATPEQIHDVFNLYNRQGKHLNAEEIRNAAFHRTDLMRAILVASGDNTNISVAPFLSGYRKQCASIGRRLDDYRFGSTRYKKSKVLSWIMSLLFVDSVENGKPRRLSTAKQIDSMLQKASRVASYPLEKEQYIVEALLLLDQALEAHSAVDIAWPYEFRGGKAGKWQELPLVASTVGVALATSVIGDSIEDLLDEHATEIANQCVTNWGRPTKTQTGEQWKYIAKVSLGILDVLGVDRGVVADSFSSNFGVSGVEALAGVSELATA